LLHKFDSYEVPARNNPHSTILNETESLCVLRSISILPSTSGSSKSCSNLTRLTGSAMLSSKFLCRIISLSRGPREGKYSLGSMRIVAFSFRRSALYASRMILGFGLDQDQAVVLQCIFHVQIYPTRGLNRRAI
jgi:hypothetical protein